MTPAQYNAREIAAGRLTDAHVLFLVHLAAGAGISGSDAALIEAGARVVQRRNGLVEDGKAGPNTRAAMIAMLNKPQHPTADRELSFYARALPTSRAHDFASHLVDHGVTGLVIESTNERALQVADELRAGGLRWLGIARFPQAADFMPGLQDMRKDATRIGAERVYADAEGKPYTRSPERCDAFADAVEELFPNERKVFTSHPGWTPLGFARPGWSCGMQLYDRFDIQDDEWIGEQLAKWRALPFDDVHPGLGVYVLDPHDREKAWTRPIGSFREHLQAASLDEVNEAEFWTLPSFQLEFDHQRFAEHWKAIARFARREVP